MQVRVQKSESAELQADSIHRNQLGVLVRTVSGKTESASSRECWRSLRYSARKITGLLEAINLIKAQSASLQSLTDNLLTLWVCLVAARSARASAISLSALCWCNEDLKSGAQMQQLAAAFVSSTERNAAFSTRFATCACAAASCCSVLVRRPLRSAITEALHQPQKALLKKYFLWIVAGLSRKNVCCSIFLLRELPCCSLSVCE